MHTNEYDITSKVLCAIYDGLEGFCEMAL